MHQVIIGLCGGKGEGKDTLAKYLISAYGFTRLAYGDALYQEAADAFNTTVAALGERDTKETLQAHLALTNCKDPDFVRVMLDLADDDELVLEYLRAPRSPRWVLQRWGTEYRRQQCHTYWLDIVEAQLKSLPRAVITDVRFPNELELVSKYEGQMRRVKADPALAHDEGATHDSERALDSFDIPVVVNTWGDLAGLHAQADQLMQSVGLQKVGMDWNGIAQKHYDWVERMGWHNKTVLESLALIASEVGEAADECFGDKPSEAFGEELADIVVRTADLAHWQGIDLAKVVNSAVIDWRSGSQLEGFAEVMVDVAKWINTARAATLDASFGEAMGRVMRRVVDMANNAGVNLEEQVLRKMAINEQRGTRGRRI